MIKLPLDDMIGNHRVCRQLADLADAAKARHRMSDHVLLVGAGGLGKTRIAQEFAARLGAPFRRVNGAAVRTPEKMIKLLSKLESNSVLCLDEAHRVRGDTWDGVLFDVMTGDDSTGEDGAEPVKVVPFTMVAATTEGGMTPSMVDRFGVKCALQYYSTGELAEIITLRADRDLFMIDPDAAHMLAERSQGVPRIAGNRLARATDQAVKARSREKITLAHATAAMDLEEIDALGLGPRERTVLTAICMEVGQAIGRKAIASVCGYRSVEQEMSILIRLKLVEKAPGSLGSVATRAAYVLLGLAVPAMCPGGKP